MMRFLALMPAVFVASCDLITYDKLPDTDSTRPGAQRGACPDGSCQSLRCGVTKPCGKVGCAGAGHHPCNITALENACNADPRCGGFNSDGWLKPCVSGSCGAKHVHMSGVDTYVSSRSPPPPAPPHLDPLPSIEDWHYPKEEGAEMEQLLKLDLRVSALHVTSNTTGKLTVRAANGSTVTSSVPGEMLFGWELRGFLLEWDDETQPVAVLQHNSARWGYVVFVSDQQLLLSQEPGRGSRGFRKGVGHIPAVRRPHYNLTAIDPRYFERAAAEGGTDFVKLSMEAASPFGETSFAAAASTLPPPHDYAIVGNAASHTKFSVAQDGTVKLANFSIYTPTQLGNDTNGTYADNGGPGGDVLVFDPRRYVSWWPAHNFSDYKTSILGRYTRAITLAAWDQQQQDGYAMTAVPNPQRGIETRPYDTAELVIELEEHGKRPRYFAVRGCVTSNSVVAAKAGHCASASGMADCRLLAFCTEESLHGTQLGPDQTVVELSDGGALFRAVLLGHCGSWQDFFSAKRGGTQVSLGHDASESSRLVDMGRGSMVVGMTTFIGNRPNYGDGVNYWSVNDKDKGSLPLESYALDHALLLWGYVDMAADQIEWYLETYVRGVDGMTPRSLSPGSNATASSLGPPGSLDLKHWEDHVLFADSFADYGRWVELWVDTARAKEAQPAGAGEAWIVRTWPQVRLMAAYMLELRANATSSGVGKGLIFGPAEHDTAHFESNWFSISAWTWRGFVQLQRFLIDTDAISEDEFANQLLLEAAAFKKDLDVALAASLVKDTRGQPFFVPPFASTNFTPYRSMTQGGGFGGGASYANFRYFSEMLSSQFMGDEVDSALNSFRESHGGTLSGMTRFRDHLDDMPANGYAYSAIATDRVQSYLSLMYGHIANYQARGTFNSPEQLSLYGDGGSNKIWTYSDSYRQMLAAGHGEVDIDTCVPSTTLVAFMLRWMLVFEQRDTDTLWLLKAAPRRFFALEPDDIKSRILPPVLSVSGAPTRFGEISFTVGSSSGGGGSQILQVNISIALTGRGMVHKTGGLSMQVRLRDPHGTSRKLQHATVKVHASGGGEPPGVTLGKVDAEAETVEVKISTSVVQRARSATQKEQMKSRSSGGIDGDAPVPTTSFALTAILE